MRYVKLEQGDTLFQSEEISKDMFIIVHGMVEMSMVYDRTSTIIERLGIGSVINSFNFIAEELLMLQAKVATR